METKNILIGDLYWDSQTGGNYKVFNKKETVIVGTYISIYELVGDRRKVLRLHSQIFDYYYTLIGKS